MGIKSAIRRWLEINPPELIEAKADVRRAQLATGWHSDLPVIAVEFDNTPPTGDVTKNAIAGAMALAARAATPTVHERTTVNKKRRLDREPVVVDPTDINALLGSLRRPQA